MPDPLPPMPLYIMQIQADYADLQMRVAEIMQSFDVFPQAAIMLAVIGDKKLTYTDILKRGYYHGSNQSYALAKLEAAGYLIRTHDPNDGRIRIIQLTDKGLALAAFIRREMALEREAA